MSGSTTSRSVERGSAELLELEEYRVSDVVLGEHSEFRGGVLTLSPDDLGSIAHQEPHVAAVTVDVARPDEDVRINGIIDVIEPRAKKGDTKTTFPGVASTLTECGSGRTLAMRNMSVMTVGSMPEMGETFVQEDCLVDMGDPGARYTPFSSLLNLVVSCTFSPDTAESDQMGAIRGVGVRIARFVARLADGQTPDEVVVWGGEPRSSKPLARVVYVCSLISEGPLHNTLLYGSSTGDLEPSWIPLTHLLDGALISSDLHYPNQRTPTYLYQRNPILEAMYSHPDLELAGVILTLRYGSHREKRAAAKAVAELARAAEANAVITHPAVGGNAHVDAVDIVEESEMAGMRSVLVLQEMAGARGADLGLVHSVPSADALVSTGNRDEIVILPPVQRVLGPLALKDGTLAAGAVEISLRSLLCSTSQVGAHRLTTVAG
jgi:glycine reductase